MRRGIQKPRLFLFLLSLSIFYVETEESLALIHREACHFLHSLFIENTMYLKLIHFQTYPRSLVPILVEGVPSMRKMSSKMIVYSLLHFQFFFLDVCFEFIPELIAVLDSKKQAFGLIVAAHLCKKYPIPRSLGLFDEAIFPKMKMLSSGFILFQKAIKSYLNNVTAQSDTTTTSTTANTFNLPQLIMTPSVLIETVSIWPMFAQAFGSHKQHVQAIIKELKLPITFNEIFKMYIGQTTADIRKSEIEMALARLEVLMKVIEEMGG